MDIAQAKQQVKDTVEAYLAVDELGVPRIAPAHQRPMFLVGAPGVGKTAVVSQVADELGIGLVSYSMTHHTRQSALGLPFIVHKSYGADEFDVSEYTMSEIIASVYDCMQKTGCTQGILFLDEINCVSETLYPSMLQFLQFKTFGRHRVPDGWVVVCAGNPPEYNRSAHEFDIATLDRLRKVEVEPDFQAWKRFSLEQGAHPAIVAFLDANPDCFYSVQSTPAGKKFVTARAWSDLSEVVALYELMGKTVDLALIEQYVQDPEIAGRFESYWRMFALYRDAYDVPAILGGKASDQALERAKQASFDERIALVGMLSDGVAAKAAKALAYEQALVMLQEALQAKKDAMAGGIMPAQALADERESLLAKANALRGADALALEKRKVVQQAASWLEECCGCADFEGVQECFASKVAQLDAEVDACTAAMDAAYAFVDAAFGRGNESTMFTTELTARKAVVGFVSEFGSDAYFAHNHDLLTEDRAASLRSRVEGLSL